MLSVGKKLNEAAPIFASIVTLQYLFAIVLVLLAIIFLQPLL